MSEKELVRKIHEIAREFCALDDAIEETRALFSAEVGEATILVRPIAHGASVFSEPTVAEFLESRAFPFRGVYTAPLGTAGVLIVCIGSWGSPGALIQRLVDYAGIQLSRLYPPFMEVPSPILRQYEAA